MKEIVEVHTELERNGELIWIDVRGVIHYTNEKLYGADADGNRGSSTVVVNDVSGVIAFDDQVNEVELSRAELDIVSDKLVCKFLEG